MHEYKIIPVTGDIKIGVIGFTASARNFYKLFGMSIPDTQDTARKLISKIKAEGVNIIIVLSHLGINDDQILADEVDGIDIIIGGHSHTRLDHGEMRNNVLIAQTGALSQAIGRIDLNINETGVIISKTAQLLDIPENTVMDPAVLAAVKNAEAEAQQIMAQPIGKLAGDFDHDFFRSCGIGNLAADALKERLQADIAIITGGLFHGPLKAGILTLGELDQACFTTANPYLSEITGKQLLESLEHGLDPELMKYEHGSLRGSPVGIPQISGLQVTYNGKTKQGSRIQKVLVNNQPLDLNKTYSVAHTDAETMPEVGCLVSGEEQVIKQEVPTILREAMADYIKAHEPLAVPEGERWIDVGS
jgi:2',3'-cyclic-nucleotide 2'-phosphodiesterase (5'-nucleotidase family)